MCDKKIHDYIKRVDIYFKNVFITYRILLTTLVTVVYRKRSLSKLKLIKFYFRSIMLQEDKVDYLSSIQNDVFFFFFFFDKLGYVDLF